ncbi:DUF1627 domain-containing protein [Escherichia coli]|nr:DUF1627 domain-containing protein [Escherichia coli]EHC5800161.1 DUF1627 domain-containing protein [Escherichia coli]
METVFDALKAMGKASSQEVAARLGMTRDEAINELWKLKRRGEADNNGPMWWLIQSGESESHSQVPKVTAQMLIGAIEQHGPKTADELALMFRITSRRANSSLAMAISKGRLISVNQNGKFRYCIPDEKINDMSAESTMLVQVGSDTDKNEKQSDRNRFLPAKEHGQREDTVADIVQPLPSFTEKRMNYQVLPSLHMANRELRRAKSHVQKWERVCAVLRELNRHRDIVRQIVDSSSRIVSEK